MHRQQSFARFITVPENRSAMMAMQDLAACFSRGKVQRAVSPVCLHGPPGSGKTHLVQALIREITRRSPDLFVCSLAADDFDLAGEPQPVNGPDAGPDWLEAAREHDLLVVEDLQYLPRRGVEAFVGLLDYRKGRRRPTVLTSRLGPQELGELLPARVTSRLSAGLVVGIDSLQASSRLVFLQDHARRRQLNLTPEVLSWLAQNLNGGPRVLDGALKQLQALARVTSEPLGVATVSKHLGEHVEAGRPTVERIAQRVGGYFRIEARQLQSARRHRNVVRPRQVGMYLARRLTRLSLEEIGAYFGGRDHTTVLHACRKVEELLDSDVALSGIVRQLQADLC